MQMKGAEVRVADSKDTLSKELAQYVIAKASAAKDARGKFVCAVSGGSLPKTLAADLISGENKDKAQFPSWHVYFADERCVPLDHEDSNYLLAKNELFDKSSIPSSQVGFYTALPPSSADGLSSRKSHLLSDADLSDRPLP